MATTWSEILRSFGAGAVFGSALTAARVYLPSVIIGQMRMEDFHMLEVFLAASASSALVMLVLEVLGVAKRRVRSNAGMGWVSPYDGNFVGGALLGVGMSLTGACPGTVLPRLVQGVPSSRMTAFGALVGGVAYARFGKSIKPSMETTRSKISTESSSVSIAARFGMSHSMVFVMYEVLVLTVLATSILNFPGRSLTVFSTVSGGLLIGFAQAVSILLTLNTLGASTAYEQVGQYFWRLLGSDQVATPQGQPKSINFVIGILLGSYLVGQILPPISAASLVPVPDAQALFGGVLLTFGARMAGGCTSGHGISGLSSLSYSSLITTAVMFGAGVFAQRAQSLS